MKIHVSNCSSSLFLFLHQVTQKKGERVSTASAYLSPIAESRENLLVATGAFVTKLGVEGGTSSPSVASVHFLTGEHKDQASLHTCIYVHLYKTIHGTDAWHTAFCLPISSYLFLSLPICSYLSLSLPISSYLFLYVPISPYLFLYVPISPYLSLSLPISPYVFLCLPISSYPPTRMLFSVSLLSSLQPQTVRIAEGGEALLCAGAVQSPQVSPLTQTP